MQLEFSASFDAGDTSGVYHPQKARVATEQAVSQLMLSPYQRARERPAILPLEEWSRCAGKGQRQGLALQFGTDDL